MLAKAVRAVHAALDAGIDFFDHADIYCRGKSETVFAQAKTPAQLAAILATADSLGVPLLLTRLTAAKLSSVQPQWAARIDYCAVSLTGFFGSHRAPAGDGEAHVAIVSGGSADAAGKRNGRCCSTASTASYSRMWVRRASGA